MNTEHITITSFARQRTFRVDQLTEFEQGFVESVLYRMGVPFRGAKYEQYAAALGELDRYVRERRPTMVDDD